MLKLNPQSPAVDAEYSLRSSGCGKLEITEVLPLNRTFFPILPPPCGSTRCQGGLSAPEDQRQGSTTLPPKVEAQLETSPPVVTVPAQAVPSPLP